MIQNLTNQLFSDSQNVVSKTAALRQNAGGLLAGVAILGCSAMGLMADTSTPDPTKTRTALRLQEPPTIDGIIDANESWQWAGGAANNNWRVRVNDNLEDFIRGAEVASGADNPPFDDQDISFDIFAGFDDENLYVAVRVFDNGFGEDSVAPGSEDGQTWLDDSVEVFIDGNNSNFAERSTDGNADVVDTGGQFVITSTNAYRDTEAGDPGYGENAAWFAKAGFTDAGYETEFRISLDAIGNPKEGDIIGFTIAVNDDDDGGNAERQIIWVGATHIEATYGNLILGGRSYTAPKTSAPTIDGIINADEYAGSEASSIDRNTGIYNIPSGDDTWEDGDHSYTAWITHDDEAVYVAVDVVDDMLFNDSADPGSEDGNTWVDDSVEIFFDADDSNDSGRGGQNFEGQYVFTANGAWRDNEANNPQFGEDGDWFAATTETASGFAIEFKVKKSALLEPADGTTMGFNIALNDDDGADRKVQLNWSGRPHSEFTYGSLTLGGAATAEETTLAITKGDNSVTVEWSGGGSLESAAQVTGPWSAVAGASSPQTVTPSAAAMFYRVR